MSERLVFLGMPAGNGFINAGAAQGLFQLATQRYQVLTASVAGSALGQTFNKLWASALGATGVTDFAMLHSDVIPSHYWLDVAMTVREQTGADVVSAACRIKDTKGLSSTAVGDPDDPWDYRRLTATELAALPETFSIEDIPESITEGYRTVLLVNTGCWVCDLQKPWWREKNPDGSLCWAFTQNDRISVMPDGQYLVEFAPEDWLFSRYCHEVGAKVVCTKKVQLQHIGYVGFNLAVQAGQLPTDTEAMQFHSDKPLATRRRYSNTGAWLEKDATFHKHDPQLAYELRKFFLNGQAGQSVLDIGCGQGRYVRALRDAEIDVQGVDGNPHTTELTDGLCGIADVTQPLGEEHQSDWVLCLEVGEHVPVQYEDMVFENVCNCARRGVIISWATPDQGGLGHVNEQPLEFVQKRIESRGFRLVQDKTERLRSRSSLPWFRQNLLVFERTIQ